MRQRALRVLLTARPDAEVCREVESSCHAIAQTDEEYFDHIKRSAFNLRENPEAGRDVMYVSDETLTQGTLLGRIEEQTKVRTARFERMLQEKYEALDDESFQAIVRCRRCGSSEVTWEEKQVRSADEAAHLFCACLTCKNRWVVR